MWHHFWQFRTRWQAWDYPNRGHKRFIDIHAQSINGGLMLPLHLGWWNFQKFAPPQVEPSYPDVIEYLGAKLIGHDAGISLTGAVNRSSLQKVPAYRRLVERLRTYEELRRAHYFDDRVRAELRRPGREFTLERGPKDRWRFRPTRYDRHKVLGIDQPTAAWKAQNDFDAQPLRLRLEVLMSTASYDAPGNVVLADFSSPQDIAVVASAGGVSAELAPSTDVIEGRRASGIFSASSAGKVPRRAAWSRAVKVFEPWRDLGAHQALGVWVHGDGRGEVLGFRMLSPKHVAHGAIADRYVTVDFEGWRYFELVETESSRYSDYDWPDGWALYHVYRELVNFGKIESLGVWYQNLPANESVRCLLSPVKALPMVPVTIRNPRVTVGGETVVFPVAMESGSRHARASA